MRKFTLYSGRAATPMLLSLLPLLSALHAPRGVAPRGVPPRVASVRCEGVRASAAPLPLLVCTTAPSLEGMAFCREALASGEYRVRALTRNPSSPRAAALEEMGAELCVADNLDPRSLRAAFEGAQASPAHTRHILSMCHKHTHTHTHTHTNTHHLPPPLSSFILCVPMLFCHLQGIYAITTWSGSSFGADGAVLRADNLDSEFLMASEIRQENKNTYVKFPRVSHGIRMGESSDRVFLCRGSTSSRRRRRRRGLSIL